MRKYLIATLVVIVALPLAMAQADTSPSGTDCGSKPTPPTMTAGTAPTADQKTQLQTFRTQMQTYDKCMNIQARAGMGVGAAAKEVGQAVNQNRCSMIAQRVNARVNNFQTRQNSDKTIYGNLFARLENIQTRISKAGVDTGTLQSELTTLQTSIVKVNADYAAAIADFQKVQGDSSTCGTAGSQFQADLLAARTTLRNVQADRLTVRTYVMSTIIPEIKTLAQKLSQNSNGTASTTSSTTPTATP